LITGVESRDANGWTPLHYAVKLEIPFTFGFALERKAIIEDTTGPRAVIMTPESSAECLKILMEYGADIEARDLGPML
jgi:hypothetical protein